MRIFLFCCPSEIGDAGPSFLCSLNLTWANVVCRYQQGYCFVICLIFPLITKIVTETTSLPCSVVDSLLKNLVKFHSEVHMSLTAAGSSKRKFQNYKCFLSTHLINTGKISSHELN